MNGVAMAPLPLAWALLFAQIDKSTSVPIGWLLAGIGGTMVIMWKAHIYQKKLDERLAKIESLLDKTVKESVCRQLIDESKAEIIAEVKNGTK